ncbi:MAG: hypothetical protein FWF76_07030 [Oscillospiraceae bacterium]|nr:hypothetical protein [Oscillospiraceae bacterium]
MLTIETLQNSGRFPHAVLLLGGGTDDVNKIIQIHDCEESDLIYVKELMPPSDTEKRNKKIPPYSYKLDKKKYSPSIRDIIGSGNMRPQFGDTRVFVFNEFDTMTTECQNTLLKFIEEPAEYNRFILTAKSKKEILTTILSRVVVVNLYKNNSSVFGNPTIDSKSEQMQEAREITTAIMTGLKSRDKYTCEYETAVAFARVKNRQILAIVLELLLNDLSSLMTSAKKPEKIIKATDVVQNYISRIEINPNVSLTTAACAAQLYMAIRN